MINCSLPFSPLLSQADSSGIFELRLKSFRNDRGRDNVGVCCSGRSDPKTGKCIGTCKTRFRVCLKNYQATIDPNSRCTFGDVVTPVLGDNTVNLTNQQPDGFVNPIRFPFEFTWPVSVFLLETGFAVLALPFDCAATGAAPRSQWTEAFARHPCNCWHYYWWIKDTGVCIFSERGTG